MSKAMVAEVIRRAVHDLPFREQMLSAPEVSLVSYDLTEQEREAFRGMDRVAFADWADDLERQEARYGLAFGLYIIGGNRPDMAVRLIPSTKIAPPKAEPDSSLDLD